MQLYTCAGAYDGAVKLYETLLLEAPIYNQKPRLSLQLAALYRRQGNYDKAFHHFGSVCAGSRGSIVASVRAHLCCDGCRAVLRSQDGPIPEPVSPFHVIMEIAVTYELKAAALAANGLSDPDDSLLPVVGLSQAELMSVFDTLPNSAEQCSYAAAVAYM